MVDRHLLIEAHLEDTRGVCSCDGFLADFIAPKYRGRGLGRIETLQVLLDAGHCGEKQQSGRYD